MCEFHCDIDRKEDGQLVQAIQTILDAFSSFKNELKKVRSERDALEGQLKSLQDTLNASAEIPKTPLSPDRRKRKKFAIHHGDMDASESNVSADLNNAAFLLSSTCGDDEDVIGPTQFSPAKSPLRPNVNRYAVSRKPCVDNSKENRQKQQLLSPNNPSLTAKASARSVTGSKSVRINLFENSDIIDEDELKGIKASEGLFDNHWISKKPATAVPTMDGNKSLAKRKGRLSLPKTQINTPKLRQATINFQTASNKLQNDEETYCDDFETFNQTGGNAFMNQESPASASNPQDSVRNALARVKIEKTSPPCSKLPPKKSPPGSSGKKLAPISRGERETDGPSTSTIIILEDLVNEIITLDDTQSSSTEFEAICGDKKETEEWLKQPRKKLGPYLPETKAIAPKSVPNKKGKDCPDCERYQQVVRSAIGGKVDDKDVFMNEKCVKHRSNNLCPATPPNFWNPRIPDTPEGEHIETPFDYRFVSD